MTEFEEKMLEESKNQTEHLDWIKVIVGAIFVFVALGVGASFGT